jgi:hypothetical protein
MRKATVDKVTLGVSAAAAIAIAGAAVASGAFAANGKNTRTAASGGHSRATLRTHRTRAHSAAQTVDEAFPVLARSAAPSDSLPPYATAGNSATSPFESGQSRLIGSIPGGQAWLAPATNGGVCLIVSGTNSLADPQSAGVCTDASDAVSAGVGLTSSTSFLVLPAGSSAVSVVNPTGATSTMAPNNNGLVTIAGPYRSASYTGPDGRSHALAATITATATAPASNSQSAP